MLHSPLFMDSWTAWEAIQRNPERYNDTWLDFANREGNMTSCGPHSSNNYPITASGDSSIEFGDSCDPHRGSV